MQYNPPLRSSNRGSFHAPWRPSFASFLVYLSLGSNLGPSTSIIQTALQNIAAIFGVTLLRTSSLYRTTPVSTIAQADFINAVCAIETILSPEDLYTSLYQIEEQLGKTPKPKEAPRMLDIDILFFGTQFYHTPTLCIPHPRWQERLFVLVPLAEISEEISFPIDATGAMTTLNIKEYLLHFSNPHNESVFRLDVDWKFPLE